MLDVLLDWAGDAVRRRGRRSPPTSNELVFEYEGVPLKDIRIGTLLRQFAGDRPRALDRAAVGSDAACSRRSSRWKGLGRQYDPDFHIVDHLDAAAAAGAGRALPAARAVRAAGSSALTEFLDVVGSVPRDVARLLREARRGKTRVDLDSSASTASAGSSTARSTASRSAS